MRKANLKHEFARFTSGKVLLVGNGPSITDNPLGAVIDAFAGPVVRFNRFNMRQKEYTGSRVDLWVTRYTFYARETTLSPDDAKVLKPKQTLFPRDFRFDSQGRKRSTGVATLLWCLWEGFKVTLHGFDMFDTKRRLHYFEEKSRTVNGIMGHPWDRETMAWLFAEGKPVEYLC